MAVYYFARSDVKGGCVFPVNGMDMRRIVRTTAYQLLPPRDVRTAASTICAPAVAHHQLGTSISATCRCICATHRCEGVPLKSDCGFAQLRVAFREGSKRTRRKMSPSLTPTKPRSPKRHPSNARQFLDSCSMRSMATTRSLSFTVYKTM